MNELVTFEKKYSLWEYQLFNYPLWIHCREPLLNTGIMVERRIVRPRLSTIFKSFIFTIKFLLTQKKYDKVFFLMERAELLEIYKEEKNTKKILFLNPEQEKVYKGNYISSDFFSFLRLISRKISFVLFYNKYINITEHLEIIGLDKGLNKYIKIAMGDAFFLKLLSFILWKKNEKIYTGAVIPMGEKFVNILNSYEVQHGVIHPEHPGYISIPPVMNTLILYAKRYETLLMKYGYKGNLSIQEYKKTFFERNTDRSYTIVIYTQPLKSMQEGIYKFLHKYRPTNVFIQKHPKDYFDYKIDDKFFVSATTPFEVEYPIMYLSSIIENFTLYDKDCYIYDVRHSSIDIKTFLNIYTSDTESQMIIMSSLDKIYTTIQSRML